MAIGTLDALSSNRFFKILVKIQGHQDELNDLLKESSITRSPYHILAFLLLWNLSSKPSKNNMIIKINDMRRRIPGLYKDLTVEELNDLTREINWKSIISELNSSSCFKLSFPTKVIGYFEKNNKDVATLFIPGKAYQLTVTQLVNDQSIWIRPFDSYLEYWGVPRPVFNLSSGFIKILKSLKTELLKNGSITLGAFSIQAQLRESYSSSPIQDAFSLKILRSSDEFRLHRSMSNLPLGLYSVFENEQLLNGFLISDIRVEFQAASYLNATGVGIKNKPNTHEIEFPEEKIEKVGQQYIHYEITVTNLCALLTHSKVAINYSQVPSPKYPLVGSDVFIELWGSYTSTFDEPSTEQKNILNESRSVLQLHPYPQSPLNAISSIISPPDAPRMTTQTTPVRRDILFKPNSNPKPQIPSARVIHDEAFALCTVL